MEGNPKLFQHALDGLGLLEANAEGQLDPLGTKRDTTRPDIRPSDPVLDIWFVELTTCTGTVVLDVKN
jgi:hypothetical protein